MHPVRTIEVRHASDIGEASRQARAFVAALGFEERSADEIALAVRELASNLVKHAGKGTLTFTALADKERVGLQVDSWDEGPGIKDVEQALADGFSTAGGLGAVNRLMDSLEVVPPVRPGGTHLVCKRWVRSATPPGMPCPLDIGVATRPHPRLKVNGDAFVVKSWQGHTLVSVIDGLGHGQFAHRAAQAARHYVESHFDLPLADLFQGTNRACRATRGVVMALARLDWADAANATLTFTSVGNVEVRAFGGSERLNFMVRRGILGVSAPRPVVTEHRWEPSHVLVLQSDGLTTHWHWKDYAHLLAESAARAARQQLQALAKEEDDATVVVVKGQDAARGLAPAAKDERHE